MKRQRDLKRISLVVLSVVVILAVLLLFYGKTGHSLQTTDTVLMVSPVAFGFNEETAVNNAFQKQGIEDNIPEIAGKNRTTILIYSKRTEFM